MGKYSGEKYMSSEAKAIANELAEANRLKRVELALKYYHNNLQQQVNLTKSSQVDMA